MNTTAVRANRQKLAILAALVLLCAAGYMLVGVHFDNAKLFQYAMRIRSPKLIVMLITAFAIGGASIVFQSVINNTIVTPCLLGMNSLYTLIHTAVVFAAGSGSILAANANCSFAVDLVLMGVVATVVYSFLFKKTKHNVLYVLLIGTVLSSFFSSIQSTLTRVMDPNEYDNLLATLVASFSNINSEIIVISLIVLAAIVFALRRELALLDVITLGKDQAINLGVDYDWCVRRLLREIKLGVWEQMTWGEIQRMDKTMYVDFNKRPDLWHAEGAESFAQVRDRMLAGIRQIASENPGGTVAAASHGAALRTLLGTLQGMTLEEIGRTGHGDNTAVSLLEVEGEDIQVIFRDDASHLPDHLSTFRRQSWHKDDAATEPGLWFRSAVDGCGRAAQALLDEESVGRIEMVLEPEALRITDYEVLPAHRGQRCGVQMLGQAVQYARAKERETLVLRCPEDMKGYFAKYGFVPSGEDMAMDLRRVVREIPEREGSEL